MTLIQEMARLRKELSLEQDKFEIAGLTDCKVDKINESCGVLRRKIRRLEGGMYK
tara:strand:+ start:377 stop:541 length:165 start_codon:yes stop_codon:yes gene_type:complete